MVIILIKTSDFERKQVASIGVCCYPAGVHHEGHAQLATLHVKLRDNTCSVNKVTIRQCWHRPLKHLIPKSCAYRQMTLQPMQLTLPPHVLMRNRKIILRIVWKDDCLWRRLDNSWRDLPYDWVTIKGSAFLLKPEIKTTIAILHLDVLSFQQDKTILGRCSHSLWRRANTRKSQFWNSLTCPAYIINSVINKTK